MSDKDKIKIIVVNKPTKEQSEKKIKELCEFLAKVWYLPIEAKNT